jgi:hypothetical protein
MIDPDTVVFGLVGDIIDATHVVACELTNGVTGYPGKLNPVQLF